MITDSAPPSAQERAPRHRSLLSQAVSQLSAYSVLVLLERVFGFALLPLYTRALTPAMYGTMELLDLTTNVAGTLMACRITQALAYCYHGTTDQRKQGQYVSTAVVASLILGAGMTLLMLATANQLSVVVFGSPGQTPAFRLLAITLGLSFPVESATAAFRTAGIVWAFTAAGAARLILSAALMLTLVVHLGLGVTGWLWSGLVVNIVLGIAATGYALWRWGAVVDLSAIWVMFRYSLPLNLSAVGMFFIHFGDRWFLRRAASLDAVGVYSLAYKVGMLIAYVQAPFSLFWASQMFAVSGGVDGKKRHVAVATYTALLYGFATVALANAAFPLMHVWVGPSFRSAAVFVPIVAIAYMIRAEGEFFRSAFQISGRTSFDAWITIAGAVVCLTSYVVLIPRFGAWGAVSSTLATFVSMLALSIWKAQHVVPYPYEWRRLTIIWVSSLVCATLPIVHRPHSLEESIGTGLLAVAAFWVSMFVFGVVDACQAWSRLRQAVRALAPILRLRVTTTEEC